MGYISQYPPAQNGTYVKATSQVTPNYYSYFATDPAKSLVGAIELRSWLSNVITNQRFHIDLGSAKIIKRIYYENCHNNGTNTDWGVKNFTIWGSNDSNAFAELTYGIDTGWTQITPAQSTFEQHVALNQADPKYILLTNSTSYRYYAFKFADTWGGSYMCLRRVELQTGDITQVQETILSDAKIKAVGIQQTLLSDAEIYIPHHTILSDAMIKAVGIQQNILSDANIVIRESILSDSKIKAIGVQQNILSDARILAIWKIPFNTNFITKLTKNKIVQTVLDVVLNRILDIFNTNLSTRLKIRNTINTNLSTRLVSYDTIPPKNLNNIIVKKDGIELSDYSNLKIQFNLNRTPSEASFILARHHDDFDHDLLGVSSIISADNKIQVYDGTDLLFTGYIKQISANSGDDTVGIVAQDVRCKISKLSTMLHYGGKYDYDYHSENYDTDENNDIPDQPKSATYTPVERMIKITTSEALDSIFTIIGSLITGHETVDFGFVPEYSKQTSDCCSLLDDVINNAGNINWYIDENEYLRFQKVGNGTIKSLSLSDADSHRHIYDTILNNITMNRFYDNYYTSLNVYLGKLYTRKWVQSTISAGVSYPMGHRVYPYEAKDITHYAFQAGDGMRPISEGLRHTFNYCGAETRIIWSSNTILYPQAMTGWFIVQWLSTDIYTDITPIVVGTGIPKKDIYLSTYGKKISNIHWEQQPDIFTGYHWLCEVMEETHDYTPYALDVANFELSQNNKLITEATISIVLDAFEYYRLSLKDLINIANTISNKCYNNNNGFPLNISGISIDCATRIVTLNLTNYGKSYYQRSGDYISNYQPMSTKQLMRKTYAMVGLSPVSLGF